MKKTLWGIAFLLQFLCGAVVYADGYLTLTPSTPFPTAAYVDSPITAEYLLTNRSAYPLPDVLINGIAGFQWQSTNTDSSCLLANLNTSVSGAFALNAGASCSLRLYYLPTETGVINLPQALKVCPMQSRPTLACIVSPIAFTVVGIIPTTTSLAITTASPVTLSRCLGACPATTFQVQNTGQIELLGITANLPSEVNELNGSLQYRQGNELGCNPLPAGASCTISFQWQDNHRIAPGDYSVTVSGSNAPASNALTLTVPPLITLSASASTLVFSPNNTISLTITNTSTTTTALNLTNNFSTGLGPIVTSVAGTCMASTPFSLAPNTSCTYQIQTSNFTPSSTIYYPKIIGDNVADLTIDVTTAANSLAFSPTSLSFSTPTDPLQTVTLTNQGQASIHIASVNLGLGLSGLTLTTGCNNVTLSAPTGSCAFTVTPTANAYGSGNLVVSSGAGVLDSTAIPVTVAAPTLLINPGIGNTSEPVAGLIAGGNFLVKNTGAFNWQNPGMSHGDDSWLTLTKDSSCGSSVSSGSTCQFNYTVGSLSSADGLATLTATGTNVTSGASTSFYLQNVLSVGLGPADKHLQYQAIRILNTINNTVTLDPVTVNITGAQNASLHVCATTDTGCTPDGANYQSTCPISSGTLALTYNTSCTILVKALDNTALVPDEDNNVAVSFNATVSGGQSAAYTQNFTASYGNDLYVGGAFTDVGNRIARWDGTNWSALSAGLDGDVSALNLFRGNLYAGGSFTSRIQQWNGTSWVAVGSGVSSTVKALTNLNDNLYAGSHEYGMFYLDGTNWNSVSGLSGVFDYVYTFFLFNTKLTVGGYFSSAGGSSVNNIAQWDGTTWSALGYGFNNSVRGLAAFNDKLYATGQFSDICNNSNCSSKTIVNEIAEWNGSAWSSLGAGLNATGYALATLGNRLYVTGAFTNKIAKWDGSAWSTLGSGLNDKGYALAGLGTTLYVGGLFTAVNGNNIAANYIAQWDGTSWSALTSGAQNGVNGDVKALFVAPHVDIAAVP